MPAPRVPTALTQRAVLARPSRRASCCSRRRRRCCPCCPTPRRSAGRTCRRRRPGSAFSSLSPRSRNRSRKSIASGLRPSTICTIALRVELDDHVRPFVRHPHVVVLVDAHGVRERRGVVVLAPLLDELQVLIEFEELRGRGAARRADIAAAGEHEQVTLRVLGHAHGFTDGVARDRQREEPPR